MQHIRTVPRRKTDTQDCEWIADLLHHGLLRGSFVPPEPIRDLRDLARYRAILSQETAAVANCIQEMLEDATVKMGSVASDALGVSGRALPDAIVEGEKGPGRLAETARPLCFARTSSASVSCRQDLRGLLGVSPEL